jgi:hypothetical protein
MKCSSPFSCPITIIHNCRTRLAGSPKKVLWWSAELSKLKAHTRRLFNRAKMTGDWYLYRNALTRYNIAIRKAKRQSWRKYCQGIDQIPSGARLMKVLKSDARNKIGTLKPANGSFTMTGQETLKVLLETHFPEKKSIAARRSGGNQDLEPNRVNRENWDLLQ